MREKQPQLASSLSWYKKAQNTPNNRETIWCNLNWRGGKFPIFKNPNQADFDYLIKRYHDEYPNAPDDDSPKTRVTYDKAGNAYRWMSGDGTHMGIEEFLKNKLGLDYLNQNRYRTKK